MSVVNMKVYKIRMLHKKLFYPNVLEVRLVADQTDLHGGTAVRELNLTELSRAVKTNLLFAISER